MYSDADSDYSNEDNEPIRGEENPSLNALDSNAANSASAQNIFVQSSNQSGVMVSQASTQQKRQLAVINEIDDRKDSKKKNPNGKTEKKKSK